MTTPRRVTKEEIDWTRLMTAYLPGRRRHEIEAPTADGALRRARTIRDRPSGDVQRTAALLLWEREGGPVL